MESSIHFVDIACVGPGTHIDYLDPKSWPLKYANQTLILSNCRNSLFGIFSISSRQDKNNKHLTIGLVQRAANALANILQLAVEDNGVSV